MNNKKLIRNQEIIIDNVDDETIVYNPLTENTHILNKTAYFLLAESDNCSIDEASGKFFRAIRQEDKDKLSKDIINDICVKTLQEMINQKLFKLQ